VPTFPNNILDLIFLLLDLLSLSQLLILYDHSFIRRFHFESLEPKLSISALLPEMSVFIRADKPPHLVI
jgi:hypothetical protein